MAHRRFEGKVVSNRGKLSLVVVVESVYLHPLYGKRMRRHRRFHVHAADSANIPLGSHVVFEECRPMSKTKRWRVI